MWGSLLKKTMGRGRLAKLLDTDPAV